MKFLAGVNQGWFLRAYGADMGRNQFSGSQLWRQPLTDPLTFDFTRPDPNPPAPLLSQQPALINQYFQLIHGIDLTRIWLFEKLEGLKFDQNNKVVGIDSELLSNLHAVLDSAQGHGVRVYLCLFDAWVVKRRPPQGLPAARMPKFDESYNTIKGIMKSIVENPSDFVANALTPLVNSIATHPAVYAIDVMNEPEGMTSDTHVVSDPAMRSYATACCQAIRPRLKASIGCMKSSTAKSYSSLPVDFADYHSYGNSASLFSFRSAGYSSKACMVGECGYPLGSPNRAAREVQVAQDYVQEGRSRGYAGALVWNRDFTSDANNASIVQWLAQFAAANNQVAPEAPSSPFAAFIEALMALFGR